MNQFVRYSALLTGLLVTLTVSAQTTYSSKERIDQQEVPGISVTIQADGRFVEREWENRLKTYGRVVSGRSGVYKVPNADLKTISANPVNLLSRLSTSKDKATLFVSADLGSGNFPAVGTSEYNQLEAIVKDFAARTLANNELRAAEQELNESQRRHERAVREGEKLVRDIERNKKEKENLLRRIDENAKELEQLTKDVETNKTTQATAQTELDNRKKAVEAVRTKMPK